MRIAIIPIIASLLVGCSTTSKPPATAASAQQIAVPDPIGQLVADLSADNRFEPWWAGIFSVLGLPETASPEDVIHRIFEMGMPTGQVRSYKILEIRQVHIPNGNGSGLYTAALVQTDSGKKIVLMQYNGRDWWTRTYDTKPSA
jgi:hypothetical protein